MQITPEIDPALQFADMLEVSKNHTRTVGELKKAIVEEEPQIEDFAAMVLTRNPIMIAGHGGSAKSKLLRTIVGTIEGLDPKDPENLLYIQGGSEVTPISLIGGRISTDILDEHDTFVRREVRNVPAALSPSVVAILADEYPRIPKKSREALYTSLAEGVVRSQGVGEIALNRLLIFCGSTNLVERGQNVMPTEARRFPYGILMGAEDEDKQKKKSIARAHEEPQKPIEQFQTEDKLRAVQNTVVYNLDARRRPIVNYAHQLRDQAFDYQLAIQTLVGELSQGETEDTTSMAEQMGRLARTYAMIHQSEHITGDHVLRSAKAMATNRVAMLSTKGADLKGRVEEVREALEAIRKV